MNVDHIPVISVSYNSKELIDDLLGSLRAHYPHNPVTIIDGSDAQHYQAIEEVCQRYEHVRFIHFDYNIHHGPGMAWAFQNLELQGPVLVLDSDIVVLKRGFLEAMLAELEPGLYGVGHVNHVNEAGFDVDYEAGAVRYLHPACMLVNIEVLRQWPMPTRHGAPNIEPMLALHRAGKRDLVRGIDWVSADFANKDGSQRFLRHDWQGTVKRSGSYNLEEWEEHMRAAAEVRSAIAGLLPARAKRKLVELGAGDGLLARAIKEQVPGDQYIAVGTHPDRTGAQKGAADEVVPRDPDTLDDAFFARHADADCWILDQALERSLDPRQLLHRIRKVAGPQTMVVAVVPNAQHWSLQARLCAGDLRYENAGLLSAGQRHWFTRATLFELFRQAGFEVTGGATVARHRLQNPVLETALRQLGAAIGAGEQAYEDAQPDQYVVQAAAAGAKR
ncbi:MAG TPA: methyltransferase domain-containing protein [Telluria sp.]|nr:methyltransferase domain-containing protein [Telluria sp.]